MIHLPVATAAAGAMADAVEAAGDVFWLAARAGAQKNWAIFVLPVPEMPERITNGFVRNDRQ